MAVPETNRRVDDFKVGVSDMKLKTGSANRETALQALGAVLMVVGVVGAFLAYSASLNQDDTRDVISSGTLALAMLGLVLLGVALFLRYSLAKFLRFWLLRQLFEDQANTERLVEAVSRRD